MENKVKNIITKYLKNNSTNQEDLFVDSWLDKLQANGNTTIENKEVVKNRLFNKISFSQRAYNRRKRWRRTVIWTSCVAIPLISGVFVWQLMLTPTSYYYAEQTTSITLQDNSIIILEPGSSLELYANYNKHHRSVKLKGTALFKIAKNKELPFIIESNNLKTTVLGTTFTVSDLSDKTHKVRVIEGIVSVENPKDHSLRILHANDSLVWKNDKLTYNTLLTQSNYFDFNNVSLAEAIEQLNTYYRINIKLDNQVNTQAILHGQYPKQELYAILRSICFLEDLSYVKKNNEISIYKK